MNVIFFLSQAEGNLMESCLLNEYFMNPECLAIKEKCLVSYLLLAYLLLYEKSK